MANSASGAAAEWRGYGMVPVAGGLGYATAVIHIYGLGPFIEPVSESFGWSRTQTTAGLAMATLVQALAGIPIGLLVDRFGPRPLGVIGALMIAGAFAMLGTATGGVANWYLLWGLIALGAMPVHATVWTSAVATRFEASRGLALAVTLCGASLAAAVFPVLGTWLIRSYGWQAAAPVMAGIWIAFAFPVVLICFRDARDRRVRQAGPVAAPLLEGASLSEGFRSPIYHRLLFASLLFTFTIMGLVVHFVPILTDSGAAPMAAAGIAALVGLVSIAGRLGTGLLLDRFPASLVGAGAFLLPVAACSLLLAADGNIAGQTMAAVLIGFTLGAEVDVVVYLASRHFGLRNFGGLYGGLLTALSIGLATGPLGAAWVFDQYQSYAPFLWLTVALSVASSLAIGSLPRDTKA